MSKGPAKRVTWKKPVESATQTNWPGIEKISFPMPNHWSLMPHLR